MRVVIAVDPSKPSGWIESALTAFPLADRLDIVVVSALAMPAPPRTSPGPAARRLYGAAITTLRQQTEAAAGRAADRLRERLAGRAATVAVRIAETSAASAIVHAAACWRADLILTGPSAASRLQRALLGSVPDDIVRRASCPVLMAKRRVPDVQRVLVATDGSLHAEAALRFLATLPVPVSAQVRVSAVSETAPEGWGAVFHADRRARERGRRLAEIEHRAASGALAKAKAILTGLPCPVQSSLRAGEAARELAGEVEGWIPDLLVLGARGRTAGPDVPLGSVAAALLRATVCPTLVVRG